MDLLDKMKDGITKGVDAIGAKGKELVEDTQSHLQIKSLKNQREKAVEELGTLAYALFKKGTLADADVQKVCETIASLDEQIAAKQAELKSDKA